MTDSNGKADQGQQRARPFAGGRARADMKTYPNGVIGRKLTDEERYDLIEYLKTL